MPYYTCAPYSDWRTYEQLRELGATMTEHALIGRINRALAGEYGMMPSRPPAPFMRLRKSRGHAPGQRYYVLDQFTKTVRDYDDNLPALVARWL